MSLTSPSFIVMITGKHSGLGGKYTILPCGSLLIHHTSSYDGYKHYTCTTINILNNNIITSVRPAKLIITLKANQDRISL